MAPTPASYGGHQGDCSQSRSGAAQFPAFSREAGMYTSPVVEMSVCADLGETSQRDPSREIRRTAEWSRYGGGHGTSEFDSHM